MRLFTVLALVAVAAAQQATQDVNVNQDCLVTEWGQFQACSVTCGKGQELRKREISVHPSGTGAKCPALTEVQACQRQACPAANEDCRYSSWNAWSKCTKDCTGADGVAGTQSRERIVLQEARGTGAACSDANKLEERACGKNACVAEPCQLGAWQTWNACSRECGGGTQKRTKAVVVDAKHGGTCDLLALGGIEERECNKAACAVEPTFQMLDEVALADDGLDRVIVHDNSGGANVLWSGGKKLYKLAEQTNGKWAIIGNYDPAPLTSISAVTTDAEFIYLAGKYDDNGVQKFQLHKVNKVDLVRVAKVALAGDAKDMVAHNGELYVSRSGAQGKGAVQRHATANLGKGAEAELPAQGNVIRIDGKGAHLWVGTWGGQVLQLTLNLGVQFEGHPTETKDPIVAMYQNATHLFVGTDTAATDAEGGSVVLVDKKHLGAQVTRIGLAKHGMCVSMAADLKNVYCGTSTGEVVKIEQEGLNYMASVATNKGGVYAMAHDDAGHLYAATYEADAAAIVEVDGFLSPKDCDLSSWSAWGEKCVEFFSRKPVKCGKGVQIREREVRQPPAWGGAACGQVVQQKECTAPAPLPEKCCHAGHVWSDTHYRYDCMAKDTKSKKVEDGAGNPLFDCRCPAEKPNLVGHTCMAPEQCHAHTCKHTSCRFQHGQVRVLHHGHSAKKSVNNHHCSYTEGRTGTCDCVCWD